VLLADFATTLQEEEYNTQEATEVGFGKMLPLDFQAGFEHIRPLIRLKLFMKQLLKLRLMLKLNHDLSKFKQKTVLTREESVVRLAQAAYVVEGLTWLEMNTVVNYLLISFLYNRISRVSRFSGVIINIIIFFLLLELTRKEEL
jgi:cytochrome c oxidase subunit 3